MNKGDLVFRVGRSGLVGGGFVGGSGVNGSFVCGSGVSRSLVGRGGGFVFGSLVGGSGVGWGFVSWGGVSWGSRIRWGFVGRGRVGWGGVGSSLVFGLFGVLGFAFVFHIGVVSGSVSLVGDDLGAAIGKSNTVRSGDDVVVGFLRVDKVVVRFLILDVVFEAVGLGGLKMS